jgi:ABC-type tungstate transport system permease subunit
VLTGIHEQERKTGRTVEIWPVPAGEALHVKSRQDSDLLILNAAGQQHSSQSIKEGYNIITLHGLSPGMYLIIIRQNEIIIESHKIIKQ